MQNATFEVPPASRPGVARLAALLVCNALLRVAGGASGILVGLYLSDSASHGANIDASFVGLVGAVSYGAELITALPMGILSDAIAPRWLMTLGALLGAMATQLFGMTGRPAIFGLSRGLEGVGAAAGGPALLAHLTDVTDGSPGRRAKVMSFYELAFLAGLALGGVLGSQLWRSLHTNAFAAVAGIYIVCAGLFWVGAADSRAYGGRAAMEGLRHAFADPYLRRLAPVWLCMNTIAGLWLGPTLTFLLTQRTHQGQFLSGIFTNAPERIGWVMLGYAVIFAIGVTAWSFLIPRLGAARSLTVGLAAMPFVCFGFYAFNHFGDGSDSMRWIIGALTAIFIMIESGFTPAALSLLAGAVGAQPGRGSAMGIYSVLLSVGAIAGSLLAAGLGQRFSVDGLICGTFGLALIALLLARRLREDGTA